MNFAITLAFSLATFTLFLFLGLAADAGLDASLTKAFLYMLALTVPCAALEGFLLVRLARERGQGEAPGSRVQVILPGIGPEAGQDDGS